MRHFTLSVSALIALTGVSAAGLLLVGRSEHASTKKQEVRLPQQEVNQKEALTFDEMSSKKGVTSDGSPFTVQLYESSDGTAVSLTRENRHSAASASKQLRSKLKGAVGVVAQGPKLNEKGQQIGERVVATFGPAGSQNEEASVFWTEGIQFYKIQSPSLKHALEFERQFYR